MLYKLKTSKVFEKPKVGEGRAAELIEEDPFAVQMVSWCPQSRIFCVVGISSHIILYRFSKYEANTQIVVSENFQSVTRSSTRKSGQIQFVYAIISPQSLEVRLQCEAEDVISPAENENNPCFSEPGSHSPQPHQHHHQQQPHPASPGSGTPKGSEESAPCLK